MGIKVMKRLDNLNVNNNFDTIELGQVTICPSPTTVPWKWTIPPDDGTVGQFLTTDGTGTSTWTSQAAAAVTFTGPGTGFVVAGSGTDSISLSYDSQIPSTSLETSGTWTPVFTTANTGTVYNTQNGSYRRVGNICCITVEFIASITTTAASGEIRIDGPPGIDGGAGFNQDIIMPGGTSSSGAGPAFFFRIAQGSNELQLHDKDSISVKSIANAWNGSMKATITYQCQ